MFGACRHCKCKELKSDMVATENGNCLIIQSIYSHSLKFKCNITLIVSTYCLSSYYDAVINIKCRAHRTKILTARQTHRFTLWFMLKAQVRLLYIIYAFRLLTESESLTVGVWLFSSPSVFRHFGSMKSKHPGGRVAVLCWGLTMLILFEQYRRVERNSLMDVRQAPGHIVIWFK